LQPSAIFLFHCGRASAFDPHRFDTAFKAVVGFSGSHAATKWPDHSLKEWAGCLVGSQVLIVTRRRRSV